MDRDWIFLYPNVFIRACRNWPGDGLFGVSPFQPSILSWTTACERTGDLASSNSNDLYSWRHRAFFSMSWVDTKDRKATSWREFTAWLWFHIENKIAIPMYAQSWNIARSWIPRTPRPLLALKPGILYNTKWQAKKWTTVSVQVAHHHLLPPRLEHLHDLNARSNNNKLYQNKFYN